MLPAAVARAVTPGIEPRSVVVAIVGGTMLTLALTRPRLRWVERLTEDSESNRAWAERSLTLFALVMGGYAWTALFVVLHKQLGSQIDALLEGAEWRLGGGFGAGVLYTGLAFLAVIVGAIIAEVFLTSSLTFGDIRLALISAAIAGFSWLFYKAWPHIDSFLDSLLRIEKKNDSTKPTGETERA